MDFLVEVAIEAGWAIPVSVVLWIIVRRLTVIEHSTGMMAASHGKSARPGWQRALALIAAGVGLWALVSGLGWLITEVLAPVRDLDVAIVEGLAGNRTEPATFLAHVGDTIGDTPGILAVVIIAATLAHAVTRRWAPALVLLVAAAGETSIFLASQLTISRARPDVEQLAAEPATSSFPSGHVAATIVTYACIAVLVLSWSRSSLRVVAAAAAIVIPLTVAWARLYQGMHFPSDVLASFVFAPLWLAACWWAFRPGRRGDVVRFTRAVKPPAENVPTPAR